MDGENDGSALIVDSVTAAYLWKRENPIGRAIKLGDAATSQPWRRVVGVVGDLRDTAVLRLRDPQAGFQLEGVYRVISTSDTLGKTYALAPSWVDMYARVQGNTELGAVRLQRELRSMTATDKPSVLPIEAGMYGLGAQRTAGGFVSLIFSTFAFVGLALVAIGMYGIVSHSIEERRREIAVRISLGAQARDILHTVLREGNVLLLIGVAIGLLLIRQTVWWLGNFIGDEEGYNALGFAAVAAVLFAIAAFAALVPAMRATKIDPADALRSE
jgi:predicted lysophospholipase L1 biosynthesis ABC-type transport system permease subunit